MRVLIGCLIFVSLNAGTACRAADKLPVDVIWLPTPHPVVARMLLLAQVRPGDVLYDLGCGDGRIMIAAAKSYGIRAVGIDSDRTQVARARRAVAAAGVGHLVQVRHADIFSQDLGPATVVTMYLLPPINRAIVPRLNRMLRPGSRVVTYRFDIPTSTALRTEQVSVPREQQEAAGRHVRRHVIRLWKTPILLRRPIRDPR